ncbi:uncharacterized protein I303_108170 [Kwoniella dejecticola CBS 10117]|uniref:Uncharacterized protein n=1 Tax=Kwoniella dejecticola CBS 10117 TaxID=1296121 RepID=A0A1A5ZY45_9TREE|nr:uncharacterized protein I303_07504 [Kwoniella dejecticola CBS 10117]OBR82737.1 hypothetical protein I303_07504 [Kwoniella dejecticola CBS 10117]
MSTDIIQNSSTFNDQSYNDRVEGDQECPSPSLKSSQRPPLPADLQIASTPSIPVLALPIPLISLPSHTPSQSKGIAPIPTKQIPEDGIPNSVRDLRSLASSVGYSTLKPCGPNSLAISEYASTVKPPVGGSIASFGGQLRRLDKSFLEHLINTSSKRTRGSISSESSTIQAGEVVKGEKRGIDEVEVEWCVHCGKESLREDMVLMHVDLLSGAKMQDHQDQGEEGVDVVGTSLQWVCHDCHT